MKTAGIELVELKMALEREHDIGELETGKLVPNTVMVKGGAAIEFWIRSSFGKILVRVEGGKTLTGKVLVEPI